MDSMFPFGLPAATAFYLVLYVATFAIHQAFMHYVLAGSLFVLWETLVSRRDRAASGEQRIADLLRDWMPFVLSAAITAGVVPLLFIQIVYPVPFYTANLLLAWRWMMVIPVLIVAFYFLYLIKSSTIMGWPYPIRLLIVALVAAAFLFVGFCWTANHLIANRPALWPTIYATGNLQLHALALVPRMLVWIGGALATMAVIAGWQLAAARPVRDELLRAEWRRLAWWAIGGLVLATIAAATFLVQANPTIRRVTLGWFSLPYVIAAFGGAALQIVGWIFHLRARHDMSVRCLVTFGWLLSLTAVSIVREGIRLAALDIERLARLHARSAAVGGFAVFLVVTVINGGLIAGCVWLVRRQLAAAAGKGGSSSHSS